ncbi:NAD(P)H-dependent oxidoreductase subunit E [Rhodoblastus acidophilus]|uniref:NAD(P)H-dependent oxidoreductase subunit E n=1 Tax=Candidatus Rhodoblastus alkanivorans TaxID=2954117 RepID=A0ABS9Z9I0_9HYPH|nr:NAD(P)H-dependent oxidoreductase subunit E [Candidatus Rhodoblastus alkanivorans]MCI4680021.1 NAD(P)H-dependent oxidoreductase subunit E [Candidatus Rhodoblastus alkanivorans]MCI4684237.1 NAD(P)H-dependent oxidoreductase subunit E [Candidatus Rhodoblastus alkanivorans]MDI4641557.1 NAD(P)H-dependent oxidoreductase subunit E [Rhodoblastus acidophilus]
MNSIDPALDSIIVKYRRDPTALLQILRDAQEIFDWISPEIRAAIADALGIPATRIDSLTQFYAHLYDAPRGKYRVLFADNITDRMAGAPALMARMLDHFALGRGEVSPDGLVSVDRTSCTGMCDQGPALLVNNRAVTRLTPERIDAICDLIRARAPLDQWPAAFFEVHDNIRRADIVLGSHYAPGAAIRAALARGRDGMAAEMKTSNLRGRGGAGFTTAVKWEACRDAPGETRYVVCNADEGEPGTFKDRVLLQSYAGQVFEGMIIAAYVTGARKGFLYLRGEYSYLRAPLEERLAEMRRDGLLGLAICGDPGFSFDIDIHLGAGAYICGEETALIESLEGKAGKPRIRPPFPATHGYLGQPTVVNNVETLCKASEIALGGGAAFLGQGTRQSTGTKIISVSGDCARPGLYEYPFGVKISQVLEDCGASDVLAVQIGGAAGYCLAPHEFERRIAFEDVPTAGAFMVFGAGRDMFDAAHNFAQFFEHESCGFCTPCRVGTAIVARILNKIDAGQGAHYELNELGRLHDLVRTSSHCGLGQSATMALDDMMRKFAPAFERRLTFRDFAPGFDLDAALAEARALTGRDDAEAHLGADS